MKSIIRKVSVGSNYKDAMHYIVGQTVFQGTAEIHHILKNTEEKEYQIWVKRGDEIISWKAFNFNMPISVENDINF